MNIPFDNQRRIEDLERRLAEQELQLRGLTGRGDEWKAPRWSYLARTTRVYGEEYPFADGTNTFNIVFVDRQYTPAEGVQTVTNLDRSANPQAIGTTVNGQWVIEDELVIALPAPPPPGSTGKGRWHLVPIKTYYWGILDAQLEFLEESLVSVYRRIGGVWTNSQFKQTVRDRLITDDSDFVAAGSWVKFSWDTDAWIVEAAACGPPEEA